MLIGAALIFILSAAAGGALLSGEISTLRKAINQNPSLTVAPGQLADAASGGPQTLLLVGDDQRALTRFYHRAVLPHSNEMLLVRFDPAKPYISMLSIPRDLQVRIYPPHAPPVLTRFNYAYTAGGIPLMLSTIKRVLGLAVNHVVVITFARFKRAVDEMGCVYSTIDHRYYHSNVGSVEQYQEINLQPGYQKLCGPQALEFVSYRHGDTALVRDARNQSFLLDVKNQFGPTLFADRTKFEQIFGRAVQTDPSLHTTGGLLGLLSTLVSSAGRPVRQVPFQANLLPNAVTASPAQISATVGSFLHGNRVVPKRRTAAAARAVRRRSTRARLPLIATSPDELATARTASAHLSFAIEYPRERDQFGAGQPVSFRTYYLRGLDGIVHHAYVAAIPAGGLDQYYDVQGMNWTGAPLFSHPDQTVSSSGRAYQLYYDAGNLKMIAWRERGVAYWLRNTLVNSVGSREMLAIAQSMQPVGTPAARRNVGAPSAPLSPPPRTASTTTGDLVDAGGAAAAFVALAACGWMAMLLVRRRRELRELREQLRERMAAEAQQRATALRPPPL